MPPSDPAPWILLRGLTREAGHWGDFLPLLAQAVAPHAVHAIDLPGNGERWRERSPSSVVTLMESMRATLRERGMEPPYRLLGLSLGAMVCVAWAQAHPREVQVAVLVNTSLRPFSPFHERLMPRSWPVLAKLLKPRASPVDAESAILELTSTVVRSDVERAKLLAHWVELRQRHPVSRANAVRQLLAAARYRAPSGAPPVPLLIVGTRGDRLVSPRCSETLAKQWSRTLVQHEGAGHDLPLDDPAWLVQRVRECG
ncbi:alpha/beta fold hydrolase [Variovorax sp. VNK109]|uniref:alpha/beta fold hydrolase n=1 Tax=Variovorax sp. VNK109 TaxID=3400919 RepID=UPI003C081D67